MPQHFSWRSADLATGGRPEDDTSFAALRALAPIDHLLFGSDCPFAGEPQVRAVLAEMDRLELSPADRGRLECENARALFPRFA